MEKINGLELINNTSKAGQRAARAAAACAGAGGWASIWAAYKEPSAAKVHAWRRLEELAEELGAYRLRITAANTFNFSAVMRFRVNGRDAVGYFTRDYSRFAWADDAAAAVA